MDVLVQGIQSGAYESGRRLPSEPDLAGELNASRATVREALAELERLGLVVRRQGSGTYVAPRTVTALSRIDRLSTLTEVIREAGLRPQIVDWSVARVPVPDDVAAALEIGRASEVYRIRRVYLAGRRHAAYCEGYVPTEYLGRQIAFPSEPVELIWHLEETLGIRVTHGVTAIAAVPATPRQAVALVIPPGTPLLLFRQQMLIEDGTPVIYGLNHLDSTVIDTHLVLVRRRPEPGRP